MENAIVFELAVKKMGMILAVQAEIEGMKAANSQHPNDQPYEDSHFKEMAHRLNDIAYAHRDQL